MNQGQEDQADEQPEVVPVVPPLDQEILEVLEHLDLILDQVHDLQFVVDQQGEAIDALFAGPMLGVDAEHVSEGDEGIEDPDSSDIDDITTSESIVSSIDEDLIAELLSSGGDSALSFFDPSSPESSTIPNTPTPGTTPSPADSLESLPDIVSEIHPVDLFVYVNHLQDFRTQGEFCICTSSCTFPFSPYAFRRMVGDIGANHPRQWTLIPFEDFSFDASSRFMVYREEGRGILVPCSNDSTVRFGRDSDLGVVRATPCPPPNTPTRVLSFLDSLPIEQQEAARVFRSLPSEDEDSDNSSCSEGQDTPLKRFKRH